MIKFLTDQTFNANNLPVARGLSEIREGRDHLDRRRGCESAFDIASRYSFGLLRRQASRLPEHGKNLHGRNSPQLFRNKSNQRLVREGLGIRGLLPPMYSRNSTGLSLRRKQLC